jgi:hypothetical protein
MATKLDQSGISNNNKALRMEGFIVLNLYWLKRGSKSIVRNTQNELACGACSPSATQNGGAEN